MFHDSRSKRVVFVAHCVLNQNAKIDRCARYPGAMRELTQELIDSDNGVVQMPCPELMLLGLDRQADPDLETTIESEDTRVAQCMREPGVVALCDGLAAGVAFQIAEYTRHGFEVVGIIGVNGSPTCGVETNWAADIEASGAGVFIQALQERLGAAGIDIPMRGVKAANAQHAVAVANELLERGA